MAEGTAPTRELYTAVVRRPDDRLDLALAALLIAKEEYPRLVVEDYIEHLDQMAAELAVEIDLEADARTVCRAVSRYLGEEQGFTGNEDEYYDPRNSYLNEVIDRRLGLPITLSIVYIEVGRRVGVHLLPVGMPGHFLVKLAAEPEDIFLDPFNSGRILDREQCRKLLRDTGGGAPELRDSMLAAVTKRQVITRVLFNLKDVYLQRSDFERALRTVELLTTIAPWDLDEVRDRGLLRFRLGRFAKAALDLRTFLEHAPAGRDLDNVREALRAIGAAGEDGTEQ